MQDKTISVELLAGELAHEGFSREDFTVGGSRFVSFTHPSGKRWVTLHRIPCYTFISYTAKLVSKDKNISNDYAKRLGIKIPVSLLVTECGVEAKQFLKDNGLLVAKPLDQQASSGVTLRIRDETSLKHAIETAQQYSHQVILQQFIVGKEVRMTVLDGEVVSALHRQPAQVVGDGMSTIGELIDKENVVRRKLVFPYISYPQLQGDLIDDVDLRVIPEVGEAVQLNGSSMIGHGASVYEILDELHDDYKEFAVKFAHELQTRFLAVDIIAANPSHGIHEAKYAFIEMNTAPALKMYTSSRNNKPVDVARRLARCIIETGE